MYVLFTVKSNVIYQQISIVIISKDIINKVNINKVIIGVVIVYFIYCRGRHLKELQFIMPVEQIYNKYVCSDEEK